MDACYTAAVLTVNAAVYEGIRPDKAGPSLCAVLEEAGWTVVYSSVLPQNPEAVRDAILHCTDVLDCGLVVTAGGTGFAPDDIVPEVTLSLVEREARGIPEAMRVKSLQSTEKACLSRGVAGMRGTSFIVNVPGSAAGAAESLSAVLTPLRTGIGLMRRMPGGRK